MRAVHSGRFSPADRPPWTSRWLIPIPSSSCAQMFSCKFRNSIKLRPTFLPKSVAYCCIHKTIHTLISTAFEIRRPIFFPVLQLKLQSSAEGGWDIRENQMVNDLHSTDIRGRNIPPIGIGFFFKFFVKYFWVGEQKKCRHTDKYFFVRRRWSYLAIRRTSRVSSRKQVGKTTPLEPEMELLYSTS